VLFLLVLCLYVIGKAASAALELVILAGTASPLWSGSWYATPNASSMHRRSSSANVLLPRRIGLLASTITVSVGRFYAELQGLIFLGLSLLLTAVLTLPLSIVTALLILVAIWLIVASLNSDTSQAEAGEWFLIIGLLLGALWMGLSCHKPRQRTKAPYSVDRFQLKTLRLNSLHDWLLMNANVARNLAERAAGYSTAAKSQ